MRDINTVEVYYQNQVVGHLRETTSQQVSFQYDSDWIESGFSISPFSLPLKPEIFIPKNPFTFDGLFGVFADSLPDGWGHLLTDLKLKADGNDVDSCNKLYRFGWIDHNGLGGLEYRPRFNLVKPGTALSLDNLAMESTTLYQKDVCKHLDELFYSSGSCGGAQPKANIFMEQALWIVKFPTALHDRINGLMEYQYMQCAQTCGICVPLFRLLPSNWCDGYFAVKRFDRKNNQKIHMISFAGLLETSHRIPSLDYLDIFKVIALLTRDIRESEEMYRRMCFNVFAHNRDDHSKNFAFLYDERQNRYTLSPAYDLTYSNSIGEEHAMTIDGVGDHPGLNQLLSVAKKVGLNEKWAKQTALDIQQKVLTQLNRWLNHR